VLNGGHFAFIVDPALPKEAKMKLVEAMGKLKN
jgi:hypothetical protein